MDSSALTGLRVLIVDDEEDFASALGSRLELRKMEVSLAFSGEEGLALLRSTPADVLLLDMRMPGLAGIDVLQRVREEQPGLPVIIITGHCSESDFDKAQKLGVQGYLVKPLQFAELLAALTAIAAKRKPSFPDSV